MKGLLKGLVSTAGIFGAGAGEAALLFGAVIDEKRLGRGEIPYTVSYPLIFTYRSPPLICRPTDGQGL